MNFSRIFPALLKETVGVKALDFSLLESSFTKSSVEQVLSQMAGANIVVCTGSSLCEVGLVLNRDGIGVQPPSKLAQIFLITDVNSQNWNMTRLSNAMWVERNAVESAELKSVARKKK